MPALLPLRRKRITIPPFRPRDRNGRGTLPPPTKGNARPGDLDHAEGPDAFRTTQAEEARQGPAKARMQVAEWLSSA